MFTYVYKRILILNYNFIFNITLIILNINEDRKIKQK